jgi:DNA-binding transcriptional ArsR family regulator
MPIVAEPRRQAILQLIWDRELAAGDIARAIPEVTFGALSQHLRMLREHGVVRQRKDGRFRYYSINPTIRPSLRAFMKAVWSLHLAELKALAEDDASR